MRYCNKTEFKWIKSDVMLGNHNYEIIKWVFFCFFVFLLKG